MTSRTVGVWRTGGPTSDQLILSQPGRQIMPTTLQIRPTRFSDLPTAMTSKVSFVPYRPCRISSQMNVAISISHSLKDRDPQQNFQNRFTIYIVSVICLFFAIQNTSNQTFCFLGTYPIVMLHYTKQICTANKIQRTPSFLAIKVPI